MKTIQEFLSALREEKQTSIDPEKTTNTLSSSPPSFVPLSIKKPVNSLIEKIVLRTKEVKAKLRRKRSNRFRQFKGKGGWGMVLAKNTITWRLVSIQDFVFHLAFVVYIIRKIVLLFSALFYELGCFNSVPLNLSAPAAHLGPFQNSWHT